MHATAVIFLDDCVCTQIVVVVLYTWMLITRIGLLLYAIQTNN